MPKLHKGVSPLALAPRLSLKDMCHPCYALLVALTTPAVMWAGATQRCDSQEVRVTGPSFILRMALSYARTQPACPGGNCSECCL
jgi:hypothetical protein